MKFSKRYSSPPRLRYKGLFVLIWPLLVIILFSQLSSTPATAAPGQYVLVWDDISPDIPGTPDFIADAPISPEVNTYLSLAANPHEDPYHGLGSATGGLAGFNSQVFTNAASTVTMTSDITMTIYYSRNQYDRLPPPVLEGPDLYGPLGVCTIPSPCNGENPDRRVLGPWSLRVTRDFSSARTPVTIVLSFSEAVLLDEFIVGSLSLVNTSYEHAIVRAFSTADATGPVVKATEFINISNLADDSTLLHGQGDPSGPIQNNALSNIAVEPSLIDSNNDGVYENIGSPADNGVYHVYGTQNQNNLRYGRAKWVFGTAIRSIAISYFPTSNASPTPFTDTAYTDQWISAIFSPFTFTTLGPTAVSVQSTAATSPSNTFMIIGIIFLILAMATLYYYHRQHKHI